MAFRTLHCPLINFCYGHPLLNAFHVGKAVTRKHCIHLVVLPQCATHLTTHEVGAIQIPYKTRCKSQQQCHRKLCSQTQSNEASTSSWVYDVNFTPELDLQGFEDNFSEIANNVNHRKGDADVHYILQLWKTVQKLKNEYWEKINDVAQLKAHAHSSSTSNSNLKELEKSNEVLQRLGAEIGGKQHELYQCAAMLPNRTHPQVPLDEDAEPTLIELVGTKPNFDFPIKNHIDLGEDLDILRIKHLGHITGHRSYYLKGAGAQLEEALVQYTLDRLLAKGFKMISVPDIVKPVPFEGCGMRTKGLHTQVYKIDADRHPGGYCLSGTAEVGIAGYFMDRTFELGELPQKVAAVSRCFRAETSGLSEARGLYRVHQFTKVEMFAVVADEHGDESETIFQEFHQIQRDLFTELGLHFQILDMPAHDLGAPAYRKFDMEAWMPARKAYGEISSTSNCTDYQSRRLKIKYKTSSGDTRFVHTLNGTACAVPRMIIAILESFQQPNRTIVIPKALQPYMYGESLITKPKRKALIHTRL
ncbi:serine--tRNA ligase, mitochondrial-like [Amphiura filiformis]|uniref:serine--tRNA ligase, mitochondrial-like n=1 Tax=Amphiura filiformis TaxID=82378 RepID=UPI003B222089